MRFYILTLSLFLQALNIVAQPTDIEKLSAEHTEMIENKGASGIQIVFEELKIDIYDLNSVEDFANKVAAAQLAKSPTLETITEIASNITSALAEIASTENMNPSYAIEYSSAGLAHSIVNTTNSSSSILESIAAAAKGSLSGAILFALDSESNIEKVTSAAASGYVAGSMEASKNADQNIIKAVKACTNGLIFGAVNNALENNDEIYKTLSSTCEGIAEAAVEASVREELNLIKQVTAASLGAAENAVEAATQFKLSLDKTKNAISKGLTRGATESIPGRGNNIRIIIKPIKNIKALEIAKKIQKGVMQGVMQNDYLPIIVTPFEDDPFVRQVSPYSP